MGILSLTTIILSLACVAIMIGLVFAVILLWPHKTQDQAENQTKESGKSR
jgi:nitrogen fixation-related uncharacterized protein